VLGRSLLLGLRGRREEAIAAITPACEAAAHQTEMLTRELCHCYAVAGHTQKGMEWLERTVVRMRNYAFLARHDVFLDNLRREPGFQEILRRVSE
jgi:lipopolysaccharide biosynthesis regulator YciM